MSSRLANAKRNTFWGMIRKVVEIFMPFVIRTIILYGLGAEYLGLSGLFNSILKVLNLAELGFSSAIIYNMYKPIAEENEVEICALLNLYKKIYRVMGTIVLIGGLIVLPFLDYLIKDSYPDNINIYFLYLIYLGNTVLTYFLFAYKSSLLSAYQRYDVISIISLLCNMGLYTAELIMILVTKNYYMYAVCAPVFTIINNLFVNYNAKRLFPNICCKGTVNNEIKDGIRTRVTALIGHKIGTAVITSADNIVISSFLGLVAVTMYNNYYYVISALIGVIDVCTAGIVAGIGNSLVKESRESNYKLFKKINLIMGWFISWCTICYVCLIQHFVLLWAGKKLMYTSGITIILLGIYFYSWKVRAIGLRFKEAAGMWNEDFFKPYVSAIVNLIINIVLVNVIGIDGVLISTIITMVLINLPWETKVLFDKLFLISSKEYYLFLLKNIIFTLVVGIITYWLCGFVPSEGILFLLLKGIICCIVPNVLFLMLWHKNELFISFIKSMKCKRKKV